VFEVGIAHVLQLGAGPAAVAIGRVLGRAEITKV
jgi:hypothetical protein